MRREPPCPYVDRLESRPHTGLTGWTSKLGRQAGPMWLRVARIIAFGALPFVLTTTGCVSHAQRGAQAQQRWNRVRARVKYQLAYQQYQHGRVGVAAETVGEAIAMDDSFADPFLLLARCQIEQGKLVSARATAELAKLRAPETAEVDYTLGVIAERSDRLADALDHYRLARSRATGAVDYLVAEAECLVAVDRPEEAIALVSENMGRFDSDGTLEMLLAELCLLVGDKDRALNSLRLAIDRSGCEPERCDGPGACAALIEEYGRLLYEARRYTEAVALLLPYVEARRDVPASVATALGAAYLATGRVDEAKRLLREEVRRRPDNAQGWMLLARASMLTDDWTTARRSADQLERLAPESAQTHLLRGFVCWKQEDLQTARDSLQRALSIDPDDALAHRMWDRLSSRAAPQTVRLSLDEPRYREKLP